MQPKQNQIFKSNANQKPIMDESKIVKFNVGGRKYETTIKTLRRYPDSLLARYIDQPEEAFLIESDQEIFIDRDPTYFEDILNYYRHADDVDFMPIIKHKISNLLIEAKFYQLPDFGKSIEKQGNRGIFKKIAEIFDWKEGDKIGIKSDSQALKYLKAIIPFATDKSYVCWECQESCECKWPDKNVKIDTDLLSKNPKFYLEGKIEAIRGKCALVKFSWSMLYDALKNTNGDKDEEKLQNDQVVRMHIPLAFMDSMDAQSYTKIFDLDFKDVISNKFFLLYVLVFYLSIIWSLALIYKWNS